MLLFSLGRSILTGFALTTVVVQGANPKSTMLWTIVGCGGVPLDNLVNNVAVMANAAATELRWLANPNTRFGIDDGTHDSYAFRSASLLWGVQETDIIQHMVGMSGTLRDEDRPILAKVANSGITPRIYYPGSDFNGDGIRRVTKDASTPDVCAAMDGNQPGRTAVFVSRRAVVSDTGWTAICKSFYQYPKTIGPDIPLDSNGLNALRSQGTSLLHELMHLRYPDVRDKLITIEEEIQGKAYDMKACAYIAGLAPDGSGSNDRAQRNAANYSLYARAAYLSHRRWIL
ncbi:hypothetical protein BKA67DRAFT_656753 [Truncatella angustata]|uniref:Lysine-specific metallo-endopeptidase domain-containing protein n=1 Tax=Truncatella angustata TaxID=152316 RepID=A0A9P8UUP9_9PEZI|nr:uncharacterized protein BKA67DRAFT_656753 [Truncatella angustata]KAH6658568.1 hypothetical protein BKA67DRAFT_656753 [Truncatella angustata]